MQNQFKIEFSDPSRSISLIQKLKKQFNYQNHYNMPRQIKSLFNDYDENKLLKKCQINHNDQFDTKKSQIFQKKPNQYEKNQKNANQTNNSKFQSVAGDSLQIPRKSSLKQSIYQKLIQAKRDQQQLRRQHKLHKQQSNQATFRPKNRKSKQPINNKSKLINKQSNNKLKQIIKQKTSSIIEDIQYNNKIIKDTKKRIMTEYNGSYQKQKQLTETSQTIKQSKQFTKYENILKCRSKQNYNYLNKQYNGPIYIRKAQKVENLNKHQQSKAESYVQSVKLRQNKIVQGVIVRNQTQQKLVKQYKTILRQKSLMQLNFFERQKRLIDSKTEKIERFSKQKQLTEMEQCTFRPKFTPYKKQEQEFTTSKSYAQLHRNKIKRIL